MRCIAILSTVLLTATAVQAQVTSVTATATITRTFRPDVNGNPIVLVTSGTTLGADDGSDGFGSGASFQSTSRVDPDAVYFKNANAAAGAVITVDSYTIVDIGFRNNGATAVAPRLESTILPAGMGLYVGPNCLSGVASCGPDSPGAGLPKPFDYFGPSVAGDNRIAGASFDFLVRSGTMVLYELKGSLQYVLDPSSGQKLIVTDLDAAEAALLGFRLISIPGANDEFGFQWDATPIDVQFPSLLAPGEVSNLTYETRVVSYTFAQCTSLLTGVCLNSYSAFGDPLKSGSSNPTFGALGMMPLASPLVQPSTSLSFEEFRFGLPTFEDGVLTFQPILATAPVPSRQAGAC